MNPEGGSHHVRDRCRAAVRCSQARDSLLKNMNVIYSGDGHQRRIGRALRRGAAGTSMQHRQRRQLLCTGTTMSGAPSSQAFPTLGFKLNPVMTITVGGVTIYHGPVPPGDQRQFRGDAMTANSGTQAPHRPRHSVLNRPPSGCGSPPHLPHRS